MCYSAITIRKYVMEEKMKQQQVGTIVGSSVHLTGAIKDSSDITIFGSVEGEISSDQKVIIEESALVKGPITAGEIIISGNVSGTVTAKDKLELNPSGSIKGNIDTAELLIHAGATFIGECKMPDRKSEKVAEPQDDEFDAEDESQDSKNTVDDEEMEEA